jgi:hypothetical protein
MEYWSSGVMEDEKIVKSQIPSTKFQGFRCPENKA